MSVLLQVAEAAGPALAAYRVDDPGPARFGPEVGDPVRRFVLEVVYEGYLMHYDQPRAFAGMDDDLRLLGGDALYALGLARLSEAGDLDAVAELADLISVIAQARAAGLPEVAEDRWQASARALSGRA